jgi:chlorite dismutase
MSRPVSAQLPEPSPVLEEGWHCAHLYYRFDRGTLAALGVEQRAQGGREVVAALNPEGEGAPQRLQTSIVVGQKGDFGLMLMDADPWKIDAVKQKLAASALGPALVPTYSFVSITEISEYVPSPDFPLWPVTCFYPMNKKRKVGENWFLMPFSQRNALMAEHAKSGMAFAGKVQQLITVGVGLEDWEWGVTLWARNPKYLTEIVYKMRFDEASARYAEFGPFLTSYITSPEQMLNHCHVR